VKTAYGTLLARKKGEVLGIITQCMGDILTLAGVGGRASDEVRKSDDRFVEYKQKVASATSLTMLDAMITQLLNYKDQVCRRIGIILHESSTPVEAGAEQPQPKKIVQLRRHDVFPVKRLTSREDVEQYLEGIRTKLYDALAANDGIQIN